MPRTVLTAQKLNAMGGLSLTWLPVDTVNLMQCKNSGIEVVAVTTGTGSLVTMTFPSKPCSHGRTGDVVVTIGASSYMTFGPFPHPEIWGDGIGNLWINPSALSGTASIAVLTVG